MENHSEAGRGVPFSRREWLMCIGVIVLVEAWWLNTSYAFHTEKTIIDYISFASTIASLLLAVIAIVYGFYQSDGQQKSSAAIAAQLSTMHTIQGHLNESSSGIKQQLAGMAETATELRRLSVALDSTHDAIGKIQGGIGGLHELQQEAIRSMTQIKLSVPKEAPAAQPPKIPAHEVDSTALTPFWARLPFHAALVAIALNELVVRMNGESNDWIEFNDQHFCDPLRAGDDTISKLKYTVIGLEIFLLFQSLNIVKVTPTATPNKLHLIVSKEHYENIARAAEKGSARYKNQASAIVKSFQDC